MKEQPWIDETPEDERVRRLAKRGLLLALLPVLGSGGCIVAMNQRSVFEIGVWAWLATVVLGIAGGIMGILALRKKRSKTAWAAAIVGIGMPIVTLAFGICLLPVQRGRALWRRGKVRLPQAEKNQHWGAATIGAIDLDPAVRNEVAVGWRAMAATETASIAAFSSFSSQLLAIGAPSEMIEAAHRDAIDEIVHARICYSVAQQIDGRSIGAAPFPDAVLPIDRKVTPLQLAKECLRESCILEGASAIAAHRLAELAEHPELKRALTTIADDEARHAEHGWLALEWLRSRLDPGALDEVFAAFAKQTPAGIVQTEGLTKFGLAGPELWGESVSESAANARRRWDEMQAGCAQAA